MTDIRYFQNLEKPEPILGILDCTDSEAHIAEFCGYKEIFPVFISKSSIKIVPSPRIDWCGRCEVEHGYDCPKEVRDV